MGMKRRIKDYRAPKLVANTEANALTDEDVDDFMTAANARPYEKLFQAIEAFCKEMALTHPVEVARFRRSLRWLRREARRRGLEWG